MIFYKRLIACLLLTGIHAHSMNYGYNPQEKLFDVAEGQLQDQLVKSGLGEPNVIEVLVAQGANVNAKDAGGDTALHLAAKTNRYGTAIALLKFGADPRARNYFGETPVHVAARFGAARFMGVLLTDDRGLANIADGQGNTPLHTLIHAGPRVADREALIKLLIEFGADINQKDIYGKSPVDLAIPELAEFMVKEYARKQSNL